MILGSSRGFYDAQRMQWDPRFPMPQPHESLTGPVESWWSSPSGLGWHCSPDFPLRSCHPTRDRCSPFSLHLHGLFEVKASKKLQNGGKGKEPCKITMPAREAPSVAPPCNLPWLQLAQRHTVMHIFQGTLKTWESSCGRGIGAVISLSLSLHHRRLPKLRVPSSLSLSAT